MGQLNMKTILCFILIIISGSACAKVGVPSPDDHVSESQDIVFGVFEKDKNGNIYFIVQKTLKGNLLTSSKIYINRDSQLAWELRLGGALKKPVSEKAFQQTITSREWFSKKMIMLGKFTNGHWRSHCYDWSVWPYNEQSLKNKSLDEAIRFIQSKINVKK